jgi:hypothetical protein
MKLAMRFTVACTLLVGVSTGLQASAQQPRRPDVVLNTPNTIRIQSLEDPAIGHWVAMPDFAELGSPTFSRDGQWIAFDGYKQGFNNSLGIGWYRANWMPDSKSAVANGLIGRERVMVRLSLTIHRKVIEQSSDYEAPFSPSVSWDGKEIIFIAKRPGSRSGQ